MACLFLSLFFGRRFAYPHFLQYLALIEFVALQFMQTRFINLLASASGNLAMVIAEFLEDMRCIYPYRCGVQPFFPTNAKCARRLSSCILSLLPSTRRNSTSPTLSISSILSESLMGRSISDLWICLMMSSPDSP